jgi:hypothetical protein
MLRKNCSIQKKKKIKEKNATYLEQKSYLASSDVMKHDCGLHKI